MNEYQLMVLGLNPMSERGCIHTIPEIPCGSPNGTLIIGRERGPNEVNGGLLNRRQISPGGVSCDAHNQVCKGVCRTEFSTTPTNLVDNLCFSHNSKIRSFTKQPYQNT